MSDGCLSGCPRPTKGGLTSHICNENYDEGWVNVGVLDQLQGLNGMAQGFGRKSLAGLMISGIAETQEVIDYCAARHIKADIELIRPEDINRAYERVVNKNVRYRFVIDMASLKAAR
jgi:alcohol dehydrogenase (NADP+)